MRLLGFGFQKRRLVSIVYFIQLILAATVGLQTFQVINASIGDSVSIRGLQIGNAHMVINDLLNVHGSSLSPLMGQVRWMIICYLIIAVFVHAGVWTSLIHREKQHAFWVGGATYFFRCLVISVLHLMIFVLWSGILWMPYLGRIQYWMEYLPSETPILWIGLAVFTVWMIGVIFLFVSSTSSKIFLIRDEKSVWLSIKKAFVVSARKVLAFFPFFLLVAGVLFLFYMLHVWIDELPIMSSSIGILLLFLVQQIIVWSKIAIRISTYQFLLEKV